MPPLRTFIQRHPVFTFYALVFAISWGGVVLVVGGPGRIPGSAEQTATLVPVVMLTWFAGPSIAGLTLIGLVSGWAGYYDLISRLVRWRVGVRWYAVALVPAPLVFIATLLPLSLVAPGLLPKLFTTSDTWSLLLVAVAYVPIGVFLEELGWTGFAMPTLRSHRGIMAASLLVGVLWGATHMSVVFWLAGSEIGALPPAGFLAVRTFDLLVGGLPAYRVLMVWVYDRTQSLLVAVLMHASLSASMLVLGPTAVAGVPFLAYCIATSAAWWLIVAALAIAIRKQAPAAVAAAGVKRPEAAPVTIA
jgi:membrane protease YdiL (CAAX protease family)